MSQAVFPGMEATEYGGDGDFWETPAWATEAILPYVPSRLLDRGTLIEPSAGRGALLEIAVRVRPTYVIASEIDKGRFATLTETCMRLPFGVGTIQLFHEDFLVHAGQWADIFRRQSDRCPPLVFGNPPYSLATEFIEKSIAIADAPLALNHKGAVVMLLQHDFATGVDRCENIHEKYKSSMYPLKRRPKFGGNNGSGKRPFTWFIWDLGVPRNEWKPIG